MKIGIVMLAHGNLTRTVQVLRHLSHQSVPVALHLDRATPVPRYIQRQLDKLATVTLLPRRKSPWGSWPLVEATLTGCRTLLRANPDLTHVVHLSGSCLPLRPLSELETFLSAQPGRDFIQSVKAGAADWVVDGLQYERFTYRFPFDFLTQRRWFDLAVRLQKRLPRRLHRCPPEGLDLCLGSQWWCLTRQTLTAILEDPDLPNLIRYFRRVWIPDESFFQTLARKHSWSIESRSLTWSSFDRMGQPLTLYDDHLPALSRAASDQFFARKVWPGASGLYEHFLSEPARRCEGSGTRLARIAKRASTPKPQALPMVPGTAARLGGRPYLVLFGVDALFQGGKDWLAGLPGVTFLGAPFHRGDPDARRVAGGLPLSLEAACANPAACLANLLRHSAGRPVVLLHPDAPLAAFRAVAQDPQAKVVAISGAWAVPLHRDPVSTEAVFASAQLAETRQLKVLQECKARADITVMTLGEAMAAPSAVLEAADLPMTAPPLQETGKLRAFLERMRDRGLNPQISLDQLDDAEWSALQAAVTQTTPTRDASG